MSFLNRILEPPAYGFTRDGAFYRPSERELFQEFGRRLNVFRSRKNWLQAWSWFVAVALIVPFVLFLTQHFSFGLMMLGLVYSMVALGTHGTIWLHRYGTHRAFKFSSNFARALCRNLTIRIIPEEVYIISHHVHHAFSEQPGDPYNVNGGFLYCFLADANHQAIRKDLSREDYTRLYRLMEHTGMRLNSYEQYQRWGTLSQPLTTIGHYAANWAFWYGAFWLVGGHALALAIFGMSVIWAFGVRTFNYDGHGKGRDQRQDGIDFNRSDLSVNQVWPGYVSGEWHNNHHLYPSSAKAGFLPYQLDLAWIFIWSWYKIGFVRTYRDDQPDFMKNHYLPYVATHRKPPALRTTET